jgi:hypothetical protein
VCRILKKSFYSTCLFQWLSLELLKCPHCLYSFLTAVNISAVAEVLALAAVATTVFLTLLLPRVPNPRTCTLDPDPDLFFDGFQDANKKYFLFFFCFLLLGTLTSVSKDNQSLKSHKTVEIKVRLAE